MDKGLFLVYTHNGGTVPCSALGQAVRALGRGFKVCIIDFCSELDACGKATFTECFGDRLEIYSPGQEDHAASSDQDQDQEGASLADAWQSATSVIESATCQMVIIVGLTQLIARNVLDPAEVLRVLARRPKGTHVVITGPDAHQSLIDAADIVTEIKHL